MKFLSFKHKQRVSFGVVKDQEIIDLGAKNPDINDLREAIRQDRLTELKDQANSLAPEYSLKEIEFLPTIPNPEKIICIGVNTLIEMQSIRMDRNHPSIPAYSCEPESH